MEESSQTCPATVDTLLTPDLLKLCISASPVQMPHRHRSSISPRMASTAQGCLAVTSLAASKKATVKTKADRTAGYLPDGLLHIANDLMKWMLLQSRSICCGESAGSECLVPSMCVQPNDPHVASVLKPLSHHLRMPCFSSRVCIRASGVWTIIQELKLGPEDDLPNGQTSVALIKGTNLRTAQQTRQTLHCLLFISSSHAAIVSVVITIHCPPTDFDVRLKHCIREAPAQLAINRRVGEKIRPCFSRLAPAWVEGSNGASDHLVISFCESFCFLDIPLSAVLERWKSTGPPCWSCRPFVLRRESDVCIPVPPAPRDTRLVSYLPLERRPSRTRFLPL